MRLSIPSELQLSNFGNLSSAVSEGDALEIDLESPECDMHPVVVCMLSALHAHHREAVITAAGMTVVAGEIPYFAKMDALNQIKVEDLRVASPEGAGAFIPVKQIVKNKEMGDFATDFVPMLHASAEQSNAVKYVLSELIRNVIEHAGSAKGAFAAAEVGPGGVIRVGVADLGIGVLSSIRRFHSAADEEAAIALALSPGVSGATSKFGGNEQNGGAGLFFMKAIATLAREHMVVVTGDTVMTLKPQPSGALVVNPSLNDDHVEWTKLAVPFEGTAVGVNFTLAGSTEFEELLAEIRNVYRLKIRVGAQELKRARFS